MQFDLSFAISIIPDVMKGIWNTILIAIASFFLACLLGFLWETMRRSHRFLRPVMQFWIDAIRSTPVLVQLYFLYFVLPYYGITFGAITTGILGLSFYFSGYLSEVFKAGINAIPKGQQEAAASLGMNQADILRFVIAPQMLRNVAAPLGSYSVSMLKATPYLAVIGVPEILGSAFDVASDTFRYAEPLLVAGIIFLILALIAVALVSFLERRFGLISPRSKSNV